MQRLPCGSSPLTGSRKWSGVLTVNWVGGVNNRSPRCSSLFTGCADWWPFHTRTDIAKASRCRGQARVLAYKELAWKGFNESKWIGDICRTQIHNEEEECWISAPQLSDKSCKKTFSSLKCRRVHQRLLNTGTMMGHTIQSLPQQNECYDTSINKKTRKLVIMSTTHECHNDLSSSTVLNTCIPAMHSLCNA